MFPRVPIPRRRKPIHRLRHNPRYGSSRSRTEGDSKAARPGCRGDVRGSGGYANDTVNEPRKSRRSYDREFEGDFIGSPRGNVRFRRSASEKVKVPCEYHCEAEESLSPLTLRCSSLISPRSVSASDSRKAGRGISVAYGNSVFGSPIGKIRNIGTHARDNSYSRYLAAVPATPLLRFPAQLRLLRTVPRIFRFPNFPDRFQVSIRSDLAECFAFSHERFRTFRDRHCRSSQIRYYFQSASRRFRIITV